MRGVDMRQDLRRLTLVLLVLFGVVALSATFWGVIRADGLLARGDNARNVIREQRIMRGQIVDRDGAVLAYSEENAGGVMQRIYPEPDAAGAVGYYSFTYGTAGIEAAYDEFLRGEARRTEFEKVLDRVLHREQQGSAVRATIDSDVQRAVAAALNDRKGAATIVDVPSGAVLGMVSAPGYDPNRIDAQWDVLTQIPDGGPLLNRVTAGLYQPGGALQTVVLAGILSTSPELINSGADVLNAAIPEARAPVEVGGLVLRCLDGVPPVDTLTLADAYVYGCPAPFARAFEGPLTPARLWERFEVLGLLAPPDLPRFETAVAPTLSPLDQDTPEERLTAALVGQGALTVTPLHMLEVVAAIANRGNGVPLHMVDAVRPPGAVSWQPLAVPVQQPALMRADVAGALRLAMLQAAAQNPAVQQAQVQQGPGAARALYGHVALAYSGPDETPYAWFVGFVDLTEGDTFRAVAVVVVLEDESDPGAAARVARAAFESAIRQQAQNGAG